MGATQSSLQHSVRPAQTPSQALLCDGELPQSEAWELATAWACHLKRVGTRVSLEIDCSDQAPRSVVDSYAWVRFELPYTARESSSDEIEKARAAAVVVRATVRAWSTLARCRGYSPQQNPAFWKRVFCELLSKKATLQGPLKGRQTTCVRDSVAFFDGAGLEFPRVVVAMSGSVFAEQIEVVLKSLCETPADDLYGACDQVQAALTHTLSRLQQFKDPLDARTQEIELCVSLPSSIFARNTARFSAIVQAINTVAADTTQRHNVIRSSDCAFQIRQLRLEGLVKLDDDNDALGFSSFIDGLSITVTQRILSSNFGGASPAVVAAVIRSVLGLNKKKTGRAKATALAFQYDRLPDTIFHALFSALPFASSVHSVSLSVRSEIRPFHMRELPWIAYAIFHPRSQQSSWRHLDLRDLMMSSEVEHVLAAMARGNNLLALLSGEKPTSDAYVSAILKCDTVVYTRPNEVAPPMVALSGYGQLEVDVCDVSSTSSPSTWNEWVAVVVPAHGLGWVRSSSVESSRAQEPSTAQLTGLRLARSTEYTSADTTGRQNCHESLAPLVHKLREHLEYLDIAAFGAIEQSEAQRLLAKCPKLRVLKAEATEALISTMYRTKLCELALQIPARDVTGAFERLSTGCNHQLKALRLLTSDPTSFERNKRELAQLIAQSTNLKYLHWQLHGLVGQAQAQVPVSYEQRCQLSASAVHTLPKPRATNLLFAQDSFSVSCAVAVLSVTAHKRRQLDDGNVHTVSAMARLPVDVLRNIFLFATSPVRRTICIETA